MKINETRLDDVMLELGHRDSIKGTEYIRLAAQLYEPGMLVCKELYPAIAAAAGTTPARVERCMRHSISTAWSRGSWEAQRRYFGYTVDPGRGAPTVGEYISRIARVCK